MVQIVQQEERSPMFNFKLKFVYFIIILTASVVLFMLVFDESSASYQDGLILTENTGSSDSSVGKFQRQDGSGGFDTASMRPTSSASFVSSTEFSLNTNPNPSDGEPGIQQPAQNLGDQVPVPQQQDLGQQSDQTYIGQPQLNIAQQPVQPQQNMAQQPQQPLEQNVLLQPQIQQPQQDALQQPQQNILPQPQQPQQPLPEQPLPAETPLQQGETSQTSQTSQCPALGMSTIQERITKSCEVTRFKNNWIELVDMYDIPPKHLLYDVDRNYVWVTVPKIASSNIKRVIIKEKFGYEVESEEMQRAMLQPHVTLAKCCLLTDEVARQYYSLQRAFTFTFIRNPWTRLYSAYRDKIVKFKAFDDYYYIRKILFTVRDWTWEQVKDDEAVKGVAGTITFTDFLTMLSKTDPENYNDHWKPWFLLTQPCMIKYDYIGYLEDIDSAYRVIKDKVFSDLDIELGGRYKGSSGHSEIIEAYNTVPRGVLDEVMSKFDDDFVIGGYSKDINCLDQMH